MPPAAGYSSYRIPVSRANITVTRQSPKVIARPPLFRTPLNFPFTHSEGRKRSGAHGRKEVGGVCRRVTNTSSAIYRPPLSKNTSLMRYLCAPRQSTVFTDPRTRRASAAVKYDTPKGRSSRRATSNKLNMMGRQRVPTLVWRRAAA
jgi:hypothetical protein